MDRTNTDQNHDLRLHRRATGLWEGHDREVPVPRSSESACAETPADPTELYADAQPILLRYATEVRREIAAVEHDQRCTTLAVTGWERLPDLADDEPARGGENSGRAVGRYQLKLSAAWRGREKRVVVMIRHPARSTVDLRGELVAVRGDGDVIDVHLRDVLPAPGAGVTLSVTIDGAWLEHRLLACVEALRGKPERVGPERLARALRASGWSRHSVPALDVWTPPLPKALTALGAHPGFERLNEGQLAAVSHACGSGDVHQIDGPPGTGKTVTLGACVWQLIHQGERVLVVAPSNAAADLAAASVERWCREDPERAKLVERGLVQRFGARAAAGPVNALTENAILSRLVAARSGYLQDPATWDGEERIRCDDATTANPDSVEAIAEWANCPLPVRVNLQRRESAFANDRERFRRAAASAIKNECRVLISTTSAPLCHPQRFREFEPTVVVVDEGSMVNGAQMLALAAMARQRVLLFGDGRQLGPVLSASATPLLRAGAMCGDGGARVRRSSETSQLNEQYRMAPQICELVNAAFPRAGGPVLRTAPERARMPRPRWQRHASVVLVDTTGLHPTSHRPTGGSVETPVHARIAAQMWRSVRDATTAECPSTGAPPSIALITPYQAQCAALTRLGVPDSVVSTAHQWQGDEADVVLFSLDECSGDARHFFGADGLSSSDGERLLYVAATRARQQLVVCAQVTHLLDVGSEAIKRFITELCGDPENPAKHTAQRVSADEFYAV